MMDNQHPKTTFFGSIMRFSTIQHARQLESHHVPTTQLRIEILHRIWYLDGKLCPNDGMFKLAIIETNSTRQQLATVLHFVFKCIIDSPMMAGMLSSYVDRHGTDKQTDGHRGPF